MKHIIIGFFVLLTALFMPKAEAYTQQDCYDFVLPTLGSTHYVVCLQNPAEYSEYFIYYHVRFYSDGQLLRSQYLPQGANATAPHPPFKSTFTFKGWDQSFTNIQGNLNVNAIWVQTYTVNFIDYNGMVLKQQQVESGGSATAPSVPNRIGYQFVGWSLDFTNITKGVTTHALYEPLVFNVTFFHLDGRVYHTYSVGYNKSVIPPVGPVLPGRHFTQWSESSEFVQSHLSIHPLYETNRYRVRFFDGSTLVKEQFVDHGSSAIAPTMNKVGFVFSGWDHSYQNVQSDITLQAQWSRQLYDVYFYHPSGSLLSHQRVEYQSPATAPSYSPASGYQFVSWDQDYGSVTSEMHIHPIEDIAKYSVYFMDNDTLLLKEIVLHGNVCPSFHPVKQGHDFDGWDQDCSVVEEDVTLRARFIPHMYTVRFYDFNGGVIDEQFVAHGESATSPTTFFPNYRFFEWNTAFDSVTTDLFVRPLGEMRLYEAVFQDYDGRVLCTHMVQYDTDVVCPAPSRIGYEFTGWSHSLTIHDDVVLKAEYTPLMFEVSFYVDDALVKRERVAYHQNATPPQINLEQYDFIRWNGKFQQVTESVRVDAVLQIRQFVVVFQVDQTVVKEVTVSFGQDAIPPANVVKKGHQFVGWKGDYTNITTHRSINAEFIPEIYRVTFYVDGVPYDKVDVNYLDDVTPPKLDITGFEIIGWQGKLDAVEQDTMVYAILRPKVYKVVFMVMGEVVSEQQVEHGQAAIAPHEGPWDQSFDAVTQSLTIQQRIGQTIIDDVAIEEDIKLNVITSRLSVNDTRYRYSFNENLLDYEIIQLTMGGQPLSDLSMLRFQSTNLLRREVGWVEIDNPNSEIIEFSLRHLETQTIYTVTAMMEESPNVFSFYQLWLGFIGFFQQWLPFN